MTTIKQLYSLQELDLALDDVKIQKKQAEEELNARLTVEHLENTLQEERDKLEEIQRAHRMLQLEADSQRERAQQLDQRLFSGEVANPRDLASLELETNNVKAQVDQKEVQLLEYSMQAQDARSKIGALETELANAQQAWDARQAELTAQVAALKAEQDDLMAQRDQIAATVDRSELQKYETLRKSKAGRAVARVERGLCQACRMSLPTQHLQRVRAGRQTVLCSSCGRMLFLG
jgi:predicted  nucleic acid-binding Zn-ribbon protein